MIIQKHLLASSRDNDEYTSKIKLFIGFIIGDRI